MDGWDVVMGVVNVIPRLPAEKFFERDRSKEFEKLEQSLQQKGLLAGTPTLSHPPAISNAEPAHLGQEQPATPKIVNSVELDPKTMAYQEMETYAELYLTEGHVQEYFMGCAADVHCGFKHGLNLVALVRETKSMTLLSGAVG